MRNPMAGLLFWAGMGFAATANSVPYFVHQTNYTYRQDRSKVLTSFDTFARRGDGAIVEKHEMVDPLGKLIQVTRHLQMPGGLVVDTDDGAGLVTSERLPNGDQQRDNAQYNPAAQCATTFGGGGLPPSAKVSEEQILGFASFKAVTDIGRARITVWRARDLGCVVLKGMGEFKDNSGQVEIRQESTTDAVREGEPSAELFAIPADFKSVSRGELLTRGKR